MKNWKYHHYISQLQRTMRKAHENFVVSSLLHDERLRQLLPLTQHYMRRDEQRYALIDLYYPQIHVAIEIDEPHHQNYQEADARRQIEVQERNLCEFKRVDTTSEDILAHIEELKLFLIAQKEKGESDNSFRLWQEPNSETFEDLQDELKETLFVKIRGKISEDKLLERQTGAWAMSEWKRKKVMQVVVVHDRVVTRVFRDLEWERDPARGNKWAFSGTEVEDLDFVGSLLVGWNYQATRVYSNDIEGRT